MFENPAGHDWHLFWEVPFTYLPVVQATQRTLPWLLLTNPVGQTSHASLEAAPVELRK
jgi:hypothetical protein